MTTTYVYTFDCDRCQHRYATHFWDDYTFMLRAHSTSCAAQHSGGQISPPSAPPVPPSGGDAPAGTAQPNAVVSPLGVEDCPDCTHERRGNLTLLQLCAYHTQIRDALETGDPDA